MTSAMIQSVNCEKKKKKSGLLQLWYLRRLENCEHLPLINHSTPETETPLYDELQQDRLRGGAILDELRKPTLRPALHQWWNRQPLVGSAPCGHPNWPCFNGPRFRHRTCQPASPLERTVLHTLLGPVEPCHVNFLVAQGKAQKKRDD